MTKLGPALDCSTVLVSGLTPEKKQEMFALFESYYDHVEKDRFLRDLSEKTHVFLFHERGTGALKGFSTIFRRTIPGIAPGIFLFSGDTVIHRDYWGGKALQRAFGKFIFRSKLRTPFRPLYWMLMSKGVKTYLMMRKNFPASYPRHDQDLPPLYAEVREQFYLQKFPAAYDPSKGLILFKDKMGSVKEAPTDMSLIQNDPEANFFFQQNPGWAQGDELACLCEIRFRDFFFIVFKHYNPFRR